MSARSHGSAALEDGVVEQPPEDEPEDVPEDAAGARVAAAAGAGGAAATGAPGAADTAASGAGSERSALVSRRAAPQPRTTTTPPSPGSPKNRHAWPTSKYGVPQSSSEFTTTSRASWPLTARATATRNTWPGRPWPKTT